MEKPRVQRKIIPLQCLGYAPPNLDDIARAKGNGVVSAPTYSPGNPCPKCSFVDAKTIAGLDDNVLKLYDVPSGFETLHPLSQDPHEVVCPVQHLVCNSRHGVMVVVKIVLRELLSDKHVKGWVSANLSLEVLQARRTVGPEVDKQEITPQLATLESNRFKLEVTAVNATATPLPGEDSPDGTASDRNAARLEKMRKQRSIRRKPSAKLSAPALNVEKARLHRGGDGGGGRVTNSGAAKVQKSKKKVPSREKTEKVAQGKSGHSHSAQSTDKSNNDTDVKGSDLHFVTIKRLEIPLDELCLEEEVPDVPLSSSMTTKAAARAAAAKQAAIAKAAAVTARLKSQIHQSVELCCLSEDCTIFACKIGQPFQRLIVVEINLRSTVEPAVASEKCKSKCCAIVHATM